MDQLQKKLIKVNEITTKQGVNKEGKPWTMYKIVDEQGAKYGFFTDKKDGTDTKVFQQWKAQGVQPGSTIGISYKEEPKSFVDKNGKTINYKQRNIAFLAEPKDMEHYDQATAINEPPPTPYQPYG